MPQLHAESVQTSHLLDLFREVVNHKPGYTSLECGDRRLNYRQLDEQSDLIALRMQELGAGRGVLVAVLLEKSIEFVTSILAVLKSGAAYLPIDPLTPANRLDYMLSDSGAAFVITQESLKDRVGARPSFFVQDLAGGPLLDSSLKRLPEVGGDDLAYVIYTSGSTGQPKGVEILHRSLTLTLESIRQETGITEADSLAAVCSPSFDVSVMETFLPLISGARLVLLPQGLAMQSDLLRSGLERSGATMMFGTPVSYGLLLDSGWKGRSDFKAVTGGEPLQAALAIRLLERTGSLWNAYGPTEATIIATLSRVRADDLPAPIGYPLPGMGVFIVDAEGRRVERGVAGELLLSGECLAKGYRNHPELTSSKFRYIENDRGGRDRVYHTGDLVRERRDGQLEFLGRLDNQVKIRGYRIELEEIESVLSGHPEVLESAVVVHQDENDEKTLVAYYRSALPGDVDREVLRSFLRSALPLYMVPLHFVQIESFPLTVNGKLDRKDLSQRSIEIEEGASARFQSSDPVERDLLTIWRRILKLPSIQRTDNFFEIGGHSILAVRLFAQIAEHFHRTLPLSILLSAPTVEALAQVIATTAENEWSPLVPMRETGSGTPFFCVHPIGGNVLIYKSLSEQLAGRPFYGIQARGLNSKEYPHTSIEAMAADYVSYVREAQPSGPYLLAGYSAGGMVAFEMAAVLRSQGQDVSLLVLIDSWIKTEPALTETGNGAASLIRKAVRGTARRISRIRKPKGATRWSTMAVDISRCWSTLKLIIYGAMRVLRLPSFKLDRQTAFLLAIKSYTPRPANLKAMLFLADEEAPESYATLGQVWQRLTGDLQVRHVKANHDELVQEPFTSLLVSEIEQQLGKPHASDWEISTALRELDSHVSMI